MSDFESNNFSHDNYRKLLHLLVENYEVFSFKDAHELGAKILDIPRFVILRHDVEFSLRGALKLARIESEFGIKSTFFLLQTSDYNCFDEREALRIKEILSLGHDIGLHYDAALFERMGLEAKEIAAAQISLFESFFGTTVYAMSSHMPMRSGKTFSIPNVIDTYSPLYLRSIKYISDSNQVWRENVDGNGILAHPQIQLLIHENTWSEQGLSIYENSLVEVLERYKCQYSNALAYNQLVREGLRNRKLKDAEFKKRYF